MKRILLVLFFSSALLATLGTVLWNFQVLNFHETLGAQICTAVTPRAQVGGARDAYDQAYAILHVSSRVERSFVTLKDGLNTYGQFPSDSASFQIIDCRIEGRPDMGLSFYFERAPVFGKAWGLLALGIAALFALLSLAVHGLSTRLVRVAQRQFSSGMAMALRGESRSLGPAPSFFERILESVPAIQKLKSELEEKRNLADENFTFRSKVTSLLEENSERESREKNNAEVVGQVRHDLRSPLSYLKVFGQSEKVANMETYHLSVQKIDRILQDLDRVAGAEVRASEPSERCLIECVLMECIAAKMSSWSRPVEIDFDFAPACLNVASVDPTRFGRIVDNVLQNAYEAIAGSGKIKIEVKISDVLVAVKFVDNGVGVPSEILSRLGSERITFGKASGNGIGLHSTKQWIEAWGGSFSIDSEEGRGTTVSMMLPRLEVSSRFIAELSVSAGQEVIVVDDEPEMGKRLIERAGGRGQCFDSIAAYAGWLDNADLSDERIFSVYDLHLKPGSGLDLLRIHPWPQRAVLYTNDYFDSEALALSAELGFRILPKAFVP